MRYLVAHPEIAELDSVAALWGATILFAALALVFLAVGLSLWIERIPGERLNGVGRDAVLVRPAPSKRTVSA